MFDQLLQLVKDHVGTAPLAAAGIPPEQTDAVHQEIASHLSQGLQNQAAAQGGAENLLSMLSSSLQSGNLLTSSITGGLVGSLASKFGLPPAVTGAIAASLPGLLQRFANKTNDPNDMSLNREQVVGALSGRP
jgi:hypothetical protein